MKRAIVERWVCLSVPMVLGGSPPLTAFHKIWSVASVLAAAS